MQQRLAFQDPPSKLPGCRGATENLLWIKLARPTAELLTTTGLYHGNAGGMSEQWTMFILLSTSASTCWVCRGIEAPSDKTCRS